MQCISSIHKHYTLALLPTRPSPTLLIPPLKHKPIILPDEKAHRNPQLQPHSQPQTRRHLGNLGQATRRHSTQEQGQKGRNAPVTLRVRLPRALIQLRVNKEVTEQGGQDNGGDFVVG